ncbi:MAG: zf-HC2 domain-containing protein [Actinomycetota bacterium]
MLCREVERLIAEYAEDALPASRRAAVASHLEHCADCSRELETLRRSVAALNAAGRQATPDLWAGFQARIARDTVAADCESIRELLPGYGDAELDRLLLQRVRAHLATCASCEREEQLLARRLRSLEQSAILESAPDLWPQFASRLATTLTCDEAEELLPAHLAREPLDRSLALRVHLENCAACAQSAAIYQNALACVDRVATVRRQVDLWPAFSERLRQEQERATRRPSAAQLLGAAVAWLRGPLLQPALGVAAFVAIAVVGQILTSPERRPQLARVIEPRFHAAPVEAPEPAMAQAGAGELTVVEVEPTKPKTSAVADRVGQPATPRVVKHATGSPRREKNAAAAVVAARTLPGETAAVPPARVAFNLPAPERDHEELVGGVFGNPPTTGVSADRVSEKDGMAAVVQAVEILAGREDVLDRPFDANVNE